MLVPSARSPPFPASRLVQLDYVSSLGLRGAEFWGLTAIGGLGFGDEESRD